MTLVPRFCIRLLVVLSFLALVSLVLFNPSVSAQTTDSKPDSNSSYYTIVEGPDGSTICRAATAQEAKEQASRSRDGVELHQINHLKGADKGPSAEVNDPNLPGLKIFLLATTQLENFPAAKAAFIRAAAAWEAVIKTPMTIYLEVDYGPTNFGQPWGSSSVIGATGTRSVTRDYASVRGNLIVSASNGSESSLYSLLPSASIPTDAGSAGTMAINVSLARAIGLINANSDIANARQKIGFNSAFDFDTDSSNGITAGEMDFEAVAIHEIGHALGFDSNNGGGGTPPRLSIWDLFRFRPGVTDFTNTQRITTIGGGLQIYYAGGTELGLSTGGPDPGPNDGDGNQSSHWRDSASALNFIGIMDPTIARGVHEFIKDTDVSALNFMGYNMEANTQPPPPPAPPAAPANNNFANAQVITGCSGSVTGTNIGANKESGEPSHSPDGNAGGASVWYQWQATATQSVTITTAGSNYDTLLGVYTGNSVGALNLITKNDDVTLGQVVTSTVTFNATVGTTYRIAVDGYGGDSGGIVLNWSGASCSSTPPPGNTTYTLTPSASSVATGASVTASWTASASRPATDWIGLYAVGAADASYLAFQYIAGGTAGNNSFTMPATAGSYEFRYFTNNSFTKVATSNTVTVTSGGGGGGGGGGTDYTLTASPGSVATGASVTTNWGAPSSRPTTDWIALYAVGAADASYLSYQYITGGTSGSRTFTMPTSAGSYEFRYFTNNSFTKVATSNTVTVTSGGGGGGGGGGGAGYTLAATPSSVATGAAVSANWGAPGSRPTTDWIALYAVGAADGSFLAYQYITGGTSGSNAFTMPTTAGSYEFRYFTNNSFTKVATSNTVTVTSGGGGGGGGGGGTGFTLGATPSSVATGAAVTANWTAASSRTTTDWIGLYAVGAADGSFLAYQYITGGTAGSNAFTMPATAGSYEFRYFTNNSFTKVATSNTVTVTSGGGGGGGGAGFTLGATPSSVALGAAVTASWGAPGSRPTTDWIGLYAVGAADGSFLTYQYIAGGTSGNNAFTMPTTAGSYEFRYFTNNSFTKVATSNTISVP